MRKFLQNFSLSLILILCFVFQAYATVALPSFTQILLSEFTITKDSPLSIVITSDREAKLSVTVLQKDDAFSLGSGKVSSSPVTIQWDGKKNDELLPNGNYTLELRLSDLTTGETSAIEQYAIILDYSDEPLEIEDLSYSNDLFDSVAEPNPSPETLVSETHTTIITPAYQSTHQCDHDHCFWNTPMDITNEQAIWDMLMSPITVVDGDQKKQVYLMSEPNESATKIADVTCASQGLHVLESLDNGWTLVETYSSSFHDTKLKDAWNLFTQGYIKTDLLKTKEPGNKEFGIVIDKLTQRLYLFQNGEMIAELLASTGLANQKQPYNETRSGEFFLISPVGEFSSDNLKCSFGIRFNDGDLLHEVPHLVNADGSYNYRTTEPKLGMRASHGCIRVQRLLNPDGINMKWIWNKIYKGIASKTVKIVIWEDYLGRQIPIPSDDTMVYYNPDGGSNYHSRETCKGVKDKFLPLTGFRYDQMEEAPYVKLTACGYCTPPRRIADIQAINNAHLPQ